MQRQIFAETATCYISLREYCLLTLLHYSLLLPLCGGSFEENSRSEGS